MAQSVCAFPGSPSPAPGCTTACCWSTARRCRRASAISSPCATSGEGPGEAIRLLLLRAHYRAELDFSEAGLGEAARTWTASTARWSMPAAGGEGAGAGDGGAVRRPQHAAGHLAPTQVGQPPPWPATPKPPPACAPPAPSSASAGNAETNGLAGTSVSHSIVETLHVRDSLHCHRRTARQRNHREGHRRSPFEARKDPINLRGCAG